MLLIIFHQYLPSNAKCINQSILLYSLKNVHQRWCKAFSEAGKGLFYVFLDLPNTLVNGEQQVCEYV